MQPNAKWQNITPVNGRQVTSNDVAYSYDRQRSLKINASLIANLDSWVASDPMTLQLTLKQPDADGLVTLTSIPSLDLALRVDQPNLEGQALIMLKRINRHRHRNLLENIRKSFQRPVVVNAANAIFGVHM